MQNPPKCKKQNVKFTTPTPKAHEGRRGRVTFIVRREMAGTGLEKDGAGRTEGTHIK